MKVNYVLRLLPLLIFLLLAFFLWCGLGLHPQELPSVKINKSVPKFDLPILSTQSQATASRFTSDSLEGQVSILNVWASWCEACQQEQVFLLKLARQGMVVYGLSYKDTAEHAAQWLAQWGNPYQTVALDETGRVAMDFGVYGTPETFLIDKQGKILYRYAGILNDKVWQEHFMPRLGQN